ncbi:MAG: type IX secretion system membrane protein PorP/SprF [Bacteroidota bacterium]
MKKFAIHQFLPCWGNSAKTCSEIFEPFVIRMILLFIFCFFLFPFSSSHAQQLQQYSQYILNDFVLNPAIAGSQDYYELKLNGRYQWVGIPGSPKTFTLSMNMPHKKKNVGLGGYIYCDDAGPFTRTGINFAYAYHIHFSEDPERSGVKLSLGLFGGLMQYKIDGSEIILAHEEEETFIYDKKQSVIVPDVTMGFYLYSDRFFIGLSSYQIFHNNIRLLDNEFPEDNLGKLANHIFITGGCRFKIKEDFKIEPSILIKSLGTNEFIFISGFSSPIPLQYDLSARFFYQDQVWLGFSYRTYDALSVLLGYEYKEYIYFGYSYDFTTSNLKKYSSGSHEVMIGYRFGKLKEEQTSDINKSLF